MNDETPNLPLPLLPGSLRSRVIDRALTPENQNGSDRWVDVALVLFCAAHLGWCLHAIGFV